jgi:phospholipid/cholesterol/gamma-HCH transport system substrate-binding protein
VRGHHGRRVPNWAIGIAMLIAIAIGSVLAWTKELPFADRYEVDAVFPSAQNVRVGAPVRIAGIEVGEVTGVKPLADAEAELMAQADRPSGETRSTTPRQAAVLTMRIDDEGRPLKADATFKLRPRLFLEGNFFVDVEQGSPSAEEAEDGFTFPINQASNTVELDQILTTLQADVRRDLQTFLNQFGNALVEYGGAEGFRELYRTSPPAFRHTAEVNEALLGTEHGDLRGMLRGMSRVFRGLARNEEALGDLVTNLRIVTGSFARQDLALGEAIEELPRVLEASEPAYANLNASFPTLRAFAIEALPGVRTTPATIEAATPFVRQVRRLVSRPELRGLVADLRPTVPHLARLARQTESFLQQSRQLSSCFNEVVIRWANDTVDPQTRAGGEYPHDPTGRVFEVTGYGISGISGENRSGDANAHYLRTLGGGGTNTIHVPDTFGFGQDLFAVTPFELLGAMPRLDDSAKTRFRPNVRCETQEPPDLGAGLGAFPFEQRSLGAAPAGMSEESSGAAQERLLERIEDAIEEEDR